MSVSVSATVRRVAAVAMAATAAAGVAALPASAADHGHGRPHHAYGPPVVISDVQHHSSDRYTHSNAALNREWVEVSNDGPRVVNLDGWTLSDEDGYTYIFRHYRLGAHQTVRVHTGVGRDRKNDVYQDRNRSVWNSDGDTATLRNDHGRFIDATSWGYVPDHRGDRDRGWHGDHRGDRDRGWHGDHRGERHGRHH
ncbi:lamin tail domain-containing protein [Streptomyces naphthomycinicus]|uniref:lamin tail domain-containing protein n=1 Tax=Streptomyces naphthomycinicus TaxID=2872625 RepID=UPI001CEC324A|nr:lamin tail domain-containing protein [Streptomyces sp. TML10]